MTGVAILDDYQGVVRDFADWSELGDGFEITVFHDHLDDEQAVAARLAPFPVVVMNRERTPFRRPLLETLPDLELLITNGMRNQSIDLAAASDLGVTVCGTRTRANGTPELTWGLILSLMRRIPMEDRGLRGGGWQTTVGRDLADATLGIVGLGRIGTQIANVGLAFGMRAIAWSPNLTQDRATEHGAVRVDKDALFAESDIVTLHMPLSERSRGVVGPGELALMKPSAYLINTSRGPLVDEAALIAALDGGSIAGAGLDVYDVEPLGPDHPLLTMANTVLTPHLGYVTEDNYRLGFADTIEAILAWSRGTPVRILNRG
ncbi:MAG: D-2-hydroxyacid dehydrogenase family protein [Alphaproteobacteria bacterium]|jgi:phosphoglycerate dehydrogenase-like enzyme|nr:D-2-hydroxyacid dehydrogenase family protein [Alphaproteobacteria bacterium]